MACLTQDCIGVYRPVPEQAFSDRFKQRLFKNPGTMWYKSNYVADCEPSPGLAGSRIGFHRNRRRRKKDLALNSIVCAELPMTSFQPETIMRGSSSGLETLGLEGGFDEQVKRMCQDGRVNDAVGALEAMEERGMVASVGTYGCLLQGCMKRKVLAEAKRVHSVLTKNRLDCDSHLGNTLVNVFVQCGSLSEALQVFKKLPIRNVYSWTALVSGYNKQGQSREALKVYHQMQDEGVKPNKYTLVSALKACGTAKDLDEGKRVHAEVISSTLESDLFIGTTLVDMYTSFGCMEDARCAFEFLLQPDVVSWNAMIIGYAEQEQGEMALQLYAQMQEEGVYPDDRTFVSVLKACGNLASKEEDVEFNGQRLKLHTLQKGRVVHDHAVKTGYGSDSFLANGLVDMYAKCGDFLHAQHLCDTLAKRDVVSWNAMIAGYAQQEQGWKAFELYVQMQEENVQPNDRTFVSILKACSSLAALELVTIVDGQPVKADALKRGSIIHAEVIKCGHTFDPFVCNTLVDMYAKCGDMVKARHVFGTSSQRNVVSWTAMITGYAQQGRGENALQLYAQMQEEDGVEPNDRTFVSVLNACGSLPGVEKALLADGESCVLQQGRAIHAEVVRRGHQFDTFVGNSLVDLYAKCGDLVAAQQVFDALLQRNVVSWSALITGYAQQEKPEQALGLYAQMKENGVEPNDRTLIGILKAYGSLANMEEETPVNGESVKLSSLENCRKIHEEVELRGYQSSGYICNALIDTYAKCGSLVEAHYVFDCLDKLDIVSWNTIIAAYALHDRGEKVAELYAAMQEQGLKPDEATFFWILKSCSNTGGLQLCRRVHEDIVDSEITWSSSLTTSLIHAYGKCGSMVDAQQVFCTLVGPDVWPWTALIAGYARQGQSKRCIECYEEMQEAGIKPNGVTFISLLAACSHGGLVEKGLQCFESMLTEHQITAKLEHYASMVDLLGRAGLLEKAESLIHSMPMQPSLPVWLGLLCACRTHNNVELAERAYELAVKQDPKHSSAYLIMSNIYSQAGMGDAAKRIERLRGGASAWKKPGRTWIDDAGCVHVFHVGERTHQQSEQVYAFVQVLSSELGR